MPSPILARADALMQRRLHGQAAADDVPTLTEAIGDDGIPLLLNAEAPLPLSNEAFPTIFEEAASAPSTDSPTIRLDTDLSEILVRELARRVEQRLSVELPKIIQATVRDFLAEQNNR
ncbi:MAG: hypothetical protein WAV95_06605 [Azonexus sp.]